MLSHNLLSDNVCLEKALFNHLSGGTSELGFQLYLKYFKRFCLTHSDSNIFACEGQTKSERLARRVLYNRRPDRRPAYFDCSNVQVQKKKKKKKNTRLIV